MARALTRDHQCQPAEGQSGDGALIGNMHLHEVQPGLFMRLNRLRKRADIVVRSCIEPSLKIAIVWRGEPEVSFGPDRHALRSGRALCIALDEPTEFRLQSSKGTHEHSAILSLTPAWLKLHLGISRASQAMQRGPKQPTHHLTHQYWQPSGRLIERLEQHSKQPPNTASDRIGLESVALEAISECLSATQALSHSTGPAHGEHWQAQLESWIHSGEAAYLNQSEMAARLGMSVRQLQRRYRDAYGSAIARDMRQRQLTRAARLLQDRNVTVDAAAELAGYRSAANFATAFRRQFGVPPSQRPVVEEG